MQLIMILIYVVCAIFGIVFFKLGANEAFSVTVSHTLISLRISWLSVLGLLLYLCSFIIYMFLIAKNQLSYLIPVLTGVLYILTFLSSVIVFKEDVHLQHYIGSIFILLGIVIMNLKAK